MKTITRKTLLYKSKVSYASYALNHAEGCSHGCTYPCYAMLIKRRCGKVQNYQDWVQPKIVSNALELLDKEIPKLKHKIKQVFLCFSTDPFMYEVEEVNKLTLDILKRLNRDNIKSVLVSKGVYPEILTDKTSFNSNNEYGSTIVSVSEDFRKRYEPFTAPIELRIKALKKLRDSGLKTWASMEPYPTPNIVKQDITDILKEISFVDKIVFGKWNYSRQSSTYIQSKHFYNSMAYYVAKFCKENSIELHIKEKTIDKDCLAKVTTLEKELITSYL